MITRDVEAVAVADLALSPPRVAVAVTVDGEILVLPANVNLDEPVDPAWSTRIVQVPDGSPDLADRNVVVVADDGPQWFRLRSLTIRGTAQAMGDRTYRVAPERIVAWDYGSLRAVPAPPVTPARRPASNPPADEDDVHPFRSPNVEAAVRSSRVMIVASRSRRGTPFAVPLWFVTDGGRIYATTSASSWTVRNVDASPRVALLLGGEAGASADRLVVRGHARAVRGVPPPAVLAQIAWRYYLQPRFAVVELSHLRLWALRMRYYRQSSPAYLVITPEAATECRFP
ncbi:pyridoxamine 5'-phosphate oxidase family protein [Mycobacterium sp. 852002-30065_SCH5024008]|uniref:pyridoxamine 5'-phosphate oxidase family protein n=1 Tax=Mycobacterium sp. 852002-30065_SCH5024008 TaxID=1834088 RepID=UPI000AD368D8|nr:pyridoxamine 5'-phosphate oxidase family protein [Mycobacterium sp. 852002-30065_SCH5024008]